MELIEGQDYLLADLPIGAWYGPVKDIFSPRTDVKWKILSKKQAGQIIEGISNPVSGIYDFIENEDKDGYRGFDYQKTTVKLIELPEDLKPKEYIHEPYKRFEFSD